MPRELAASQVPPASVRICTGLGRLAPLGEMHARGGDHHGLHGGRHPSEVDAQVHRLLSLCTPLAHTHTQRSI